MDIYAPLFLQMLEDFATGTETPVYPFAAGSVWDMLFSIGVNAVAYGLERGLMLADELSPKATNAARSEL